MDNTCVECQKYKDKLNQVLSECESIFDAVFDMREFEEKCSKTCKYKGTE